MSIQYNSLGNSVPQIYTVSTTVTTAHVHLVCTPLSKFRILNITAHAASSVSTAITVTLDSKLGATYDTKLSSDTAWVDLYKIGEPTEVFEYGDAINIDCLNTEDIVKTVTIRVELL